MESESERYEPLEIIGRGSFGIIRKVRRKADHHVSLYFAAAPKAALPHAAAEHLADIMSKGNLVPAHVAEGARAAAGGAVHPQGPPTPQHCRLL